MEESPKAAAAVISFEELDSPLPRPGSSTAACLPRRLVDSGDQHADDTPSLEGVDPSGVACARSLTGRITQALVKAACASAPTNAHAVSHCQGLLLRARLSLARCIPWWARCPCPVPTSTAISVAGLLAPWDDVLQLSERRTPWDLQKAGARLAAEIPFKTAQELFRELTACR